MCDQPYTAIGLHRFAVRVIRTAILVAALALLGCRDRRADSGTISLEVAVVGSAQPDTDTWIVVGDGAGSTVLGAQHVQGDGLISFGDVSDELISVSVITRESNNSVIVKSYLYTLGGVWTVVRGPGPVIGQANVTMHFAYGNYDTYVMETPGGHLSASRFIDLRDSLTEYIVPVEVHTLESGDRFSVYARMWSLSFREHVMGWTVDQPFRRGEVNSYDVYLDQPVSLRQIGSTRSIRLAWISGIRTEACIGYTMAFPATAFFWETELEVEVPAFPADKVRMRCWGQTGDDFYYVWTGSELPLSLGIPTGSLTASCSAPEPRAENIVVAGAADGVVAEFVFAQAEGGVCRWYVYAPIGTDALERPVIPDSISGALPWGTLSLTGVQIRMVDYDTAPDYDGLISILCRSEEAEACRYREYYEYVDSLYRPATQ